MQFADSMWGNIDNTVSLPFPSHLSSMCLFQNEAVDTKVYSSS